MFYLTGRAAREGESLDLCIPRLISRQLTRMYNRRPLSEEGLETDPWILELPVLILWENHRRIKDTGRRRVPLRCYSGPGQDRKKRLRGPSIHPVSY